MQNIGGGPCPVAHMNFLDQQARQSQTNLRKLDSIARKQTFRLDLAPNQYSSMYELITPAEFG
jgi:hypothetical protein